MSKIFLDKDIFVEWLREVIRGELTSGDITTPKLVNPILEETTVTLKDLKDLLDDLKLQKGRPDFSLFPTGKPVLKDDFEAVNLKWAGSGSATTWAVARETGAGLVFNGEASMRLTSPAVAYGWVLAERRVGTLPKMKLGVETWWHMIGTNIDAVRFEIMYYDGSYLHDAKLLYHPYFQRWRYLDQTGAWVDVPNGAQIIRLETFNYFKMIVDLPNDRYVRLYSGGMERDLSALSSYRASDTTAPATVLLVRLFTGADVAQDLIIDDYLLTMED